MVMGTRSSLIECLQKISQQIDVSALSVSPDIICHQKLFIDVLYLYAWEFFTKFLVGGGDLLSGTIFRSPSGTESDGGGGGTHVRDGVRWGGTKENAGGALVFEVGYHPHKKINAIRVVFLDQAMYMRILFRGAKIMCKIGKKGSYWLILERTWWKSKKNACKNAYLGFIFIAEKYLFRVCFESPFMRMISSLKYKYPPGKLSAEAKNVPPTAKLEQILVF